MPELPEVETVVRELRKSILGREIKDARAFARQLFEEKSLFSSFGKLVRGDTFIFIDRIGKYLLFHLASKRVMVAHMKMTGKFLLADRGQRIGDNYVRFVMEFKDGGKLLYADVRKFGRIWLIAESRLADFFAKRKMGRDALSKLCTEEYFQTQIARNKAIKNVLLDQTCIAGVGNIYADEMLWQAKIHPLKKGSDLTESEAQTLHKAMGKVLALGIKMGGASMSDYVKPDGSPGAFQTKRKVYKREGKPCARCKTPIRRIVIGQRSTHYCPRCQIK